MATNRTIGFEIQILNKEKLSEVDKIVKELNTKGIKLKIDLGNDLKNLQSIIDSLKDVKNTLGQNVNSGISTTVKQDVEDIKKEKKALEELEQAKQRMATQKANSPIDLSRDIKSYDALQQRVDEIKQSMTSISSIKMDTNVMGGLEKAVISYKNNMNQVVSETMRWVDVINENGDVIGQKFQTAGTIKVSDNIGKQTEKLEKEAQKQAQIIEKLQNKYNSLKGMSIQLEDSGLFSKSRFNSTVGKYFDKIDYSNIQNYEKELEKLEKRINTTFNNAKKLQDLNKLKLNTNLGFDNIKNTESFSQIPKELVDNFKVAKQEFDKFVQKFKDNTQTINKLKLDNAINNYTNSFKQLENASNSLEKLGRKAEETKTKLSSSLASKQTFGVYESIFTNLQQRINSINTDTPIAEIKQLELEIANIGKNSNQIQTVKKAINDLTSNINGLKSKYKGIVGNKDTINELTATESELKNLKNILKDLQSGKAFDGSAIRNATNNASSSFKNLKNAVLDSDKSIRLTQQDAITLGGAIKKALANVGIYTSAYTVVNRLSRAIRNGVSDVIALEDSMISLQRIYNITGESVQDFQDKLVETSRQLATSSTDYIDSVTAFKKLGYEINEAQRLATETTKFNLAGDINNMEEATTDVVSILKGFGIEAENVTSVVDELNTTANEYALSAQDIANILQRSSSSLASAGNTLEQSIAMGTVAQEVNQNAERVGNSLKTLSLRIRGVSENGEELSATLREDVKAWTGFDILKDDQKTFKSTFDIIKGIGKEWDKLNGLQKASLSQDLFGKQQANIGITLLENYEKLDEVMTSIQNSSGSVQNEFNRYLDSTSAKIEQLKVSMTQMWTGLINSDITKGVVSGLTNLVDTFGNLEGVILLVTTAIAIFKGQAIKDILAVCAGETALSVATVGVSTAFKTLSTAIATNPFGFLMVSLTALIALMGTAKTQTEEFEESITSFQNAQNDLKQVESNEDLVKEYTELDEKIKSNTLSTEEMNESKSELLNLQKQLAELFPDLISGFDKEGNAIVTNLDKVNGKIGETKDNALKQLKASYESALNTLNDPISGDSIWDKIGIDTTGLRDLLDQDKELYDKYFKEDPVIEAIINPNTIEAYQAYLEMMEKGIVRTQDQEDEFNKLKDRIQEVNDMASQIYATSGGDLSQLEGYDWIDLDTGEVVSAVQHFKDLSSEAEVSSDKIMELYNSGKDLQSIADELGISLDEVKSCISDVGDSAENTADSVKNMKNAFSEASDTIEILQKAMEEYSGNQGNLSTDTIGKLMDLYLETGNTEYVAMLGDSNNFMERANALLETQTQLRDENYQKIIQEAMGIENQGNTAVQTENNKIKASANATNQMAQHYKTNTQNHAMSEQSKAKNAESVANAMLKGNGAVVNELSTQYGVDANNFNNAVNSKIDSLNSLIDAGILAGKVASSLGVAGGSIIGKQSASHSSVGYNPNYVGFNPVGISSGSSSGSGSSGSSGSGSSSEKDYTVENLNLEDYIERHYKLEDKLRDVRHEQEMLSKEIENSYGKEKLDLQQQYINKLKEEQNLTNQLIKSKQSELWDTRVKLSGYGIDFDASGNIKNMTEIYTKLINASNAINDSTEAGAEQEKKMQENIKSLKSLIGDYNSLQQEIQGLQEDYKELSNTIKQAYRDIADSYADLESSLNTILKDKIDKLFEKESEALDKLKDKINKTFEDDETADKKAEYEQNLLDLRSQIEDAMRTGDKTLIAELKKEYADAQKEYSDYIKELEKDNALDRIEEEKDKLDEQKEEMLSSENMSKLIQQAISQGYVEIGNSVYETQQLMKDYTNETVVGYQNIKNELDSYLTSLKTGIELTSQLSSINSNLGLVSNITYDSNMSKNISNAIKKANSENANRIINFNNALLSVDKVDGNTDINALAEKVSSMVLQKINNAL